MAKYIAANFIKTILLISVLLITIGQPMEASAYSPPEYIKVGLKHGSTAPTQCTIKSADGFMLGVADDIAGYTETLPLPAYTQLVASVTDGHVELRDAAGVLISADIGVNGCLIPYNGNSNLVSVDGKSYRGGIILKGTIDNKLIVINYLPLEEYIYGVVHREIGMRNPMEALKAQAITARTFAALNKNRHSSLGFDVCAGTHCQVYGGYSDEYESTNRAVDETKGMIIYCGGKPAETYYYKNSGGHTQNSEDVWTSAASHLRGIPDPYCPEYPWEAVIGYDTLRQKLIQANLDPGNIVTARIGKRNSSGAVSTLIIKGDERELTLEKTKIRDILGASLVRSTHFDIDGEKEEIKPVEDDFKLALLSSSKKKNLDAKESIYILSAGDSISSGEISSLSMTKGTGIAKVSAYIKNSSSPGTTGEASGKGSLVLKGLGYGHGVGMAQDGAIEMAKRGMSYMDILKFYFTGIEVN